MGCCRQVTVEPVLFLFITSLMMQIPVTQLLLLRKVCLEEHDDSICQELGNYPQLENQVQSKTSHWILKLNLAMNIPGAIMCTILGAASDKFGRRTIIAFPLIGACVASINFMINSFYTDLPIRYMLISSFALGICGGMGTCQVALVSYITDITDSSNRTKRFGMLESMVFLGGTIGLLLAGSIAQKISIPAVYACCFLLNLTAVGYVLAILPESLSTKQRLSSKLEDAMAKRRGWMSGFGFSVLENMRKTFTVCFVERENKKRKWLLLLQVIAMLHMLALSGDMELTVLYTKHTPLSWSTFTIAVYMALRNIARAAALLITMPLLFHFKSQRTQDNDFNLTIVGLASNMSGYIMIAMAKSTAVMMLVPVVSSLAGIAGAVLGSLRSKLVEPDEMGAMFAFGSLLETMCHLIGSVIFNNMYPATLDFMPGFSFLIIAALIGTIMCIVIYFKWDYEDTILFPKVISNGEQTDNLLTYVDSDEEVELYDLKSCEG
ncbi:lysosomal proton-coupled steroid conjugate and bile acid symporter SLC46A3-like [Antedon mediterranea]|uniref:lysosomal proton-coupled steroid conjugate and bile acid symporter SLC46A3-like n=1 Tax=Antedon mediterranea TaxID=105859 RepID=UPI003AF47C32